MEADWDYDWLEYMDYEYPLDWCDSGCTICFPEV